MALAFASVFLGPGLALAQQSADHRLTEHVFNAGGRPMDGQVSSSASYRITLDAIGDSVTPLRLSGGAFQLDGGLVGSFPPPEEVRDLRFASKTQMTWATEPSTGTYNLYRGDLATLPGLAYGSCLGSGIALTTTTDLEDPTPGEAFFYLVTAENLIMEEGVKGYDSSGQLNPNPSPCP